MTRRTGKHESRVIQKEKQLEEERDRRGQNTEQATGRAGQQKGRLEKRENGHSPIDSRSCCIDASSEHRQNREAKRKKKNRGRKEARQEQKTAAK